MRRARMSPGRVWRVRVVPEPFWSFPGKAERSLEKTWTVFGGRWWLEELARAVNDSERRSRPRTPLGAVVPQNEKFVKFTTSVWQTSELNSDSTSWLHIYLKAIRAEFSSCGIRTQLRKTELFSSSGAKQNFWQLCALWTKLNRLFCSKVSRENITSTGKRLVGKVPVPYMYICINRANLFVITGTHRSYTSA